MPYIGNVINSFAVETGNINDQAVTAPKLSATGGTNGQVLALDSNLNLEWVSDPAGQWVTNGSDIYYNDGNVGIGVASPGQKLDVRDSGTTAAIRIHSGTVSSNTSTSTLEFLSSFSGSGVLGTAQINSNAPAGGQSELSFLTSPASNSPTERMRIDSSGNVGIGTSSPDDYLTIADTSTSGDIGLRFKGDASSRQFIMFGDPGGTQLGDIMYDHGTNALRFRTNNSEQMRIDSSGRLGVGLTPSSAESIANVSAGLIQTDGNIDIRYPGTNVDPAGARYLSFVNTDSTLVADQPMGGIRWVGNDTSNTSRDSASILAINDGNAGLASHITFNNDGGTERMRIDTSGNVGIGTTSPNNYSNYSTLTINGTTGGIIDLEANGTISGELQAFSNEFRINAVGASGVLKMYAGASLRMQIDSSGNVGIGETSPGANLVVKENGTTGTDHSLQQWRTASGGFMQLRNENLGLSQPYFEFTTGTNEDIIFSPGGNVGIGTTTPSHRFDVYQNTADFAARIQNDGSTGLGLKIGAGAGTAGDYILQLTDRDGNSKVVFESSGHVGIGTTSPFSTNGTNLEVLHDNSSGASRLILNNTDSSGLRYYIQSQNDGALGFGDFTNSERLRIASSGNVGIGTTDPSLGVLDVRSTSTATPYGFDVARFNNADPANSASQTTFISIGTAYTDDHEGVVRIGAERSGSGNKANLVFHNTDSASSSSEKARIDSSGRLLVGLSTVTGGYNGKIVSRNDVDYTSTEFEDNATLVLQNETNNNSAVLVFHSNNGSGSSGRAAIVGGTVNNGLGKLGFYGSCMNKDSSTDADVTIDSDGRLLIGETSVEDTNSTFETYKASGHNMMRVQSDSLANGQYSLIRAHGSSGSIRQAWIGVYKHSGITNAAALMLLEQEDGGNSYYWTDNSGNLRTSTNANHVGTTSGTVVGTQTSDLRLKNVGANVSYGLAEVKQLQPKQYALKDAPDVNKLGFIAQEVESIIPEAVFDTNEELEGHQEGDRTKLGMEYVQLIPVLVNAIKELSAEVDTLKTKVAALEAE